MLMLTGPLPAFQPLQLVQRTSCANCDCSNAVSVAYFLPAAYVAVFPHPKLSCPTPLPDLCVSTALNAIDSCGTRAVLF